MNLFETLLFKISAVRLSARTSKDFLLDMNNASQSNKSRPRLIVEIGVVLCCKLAFIFGLWYFFFSPDKRIEQTPENVASGILMRSDRTVDEGDSYK